MTLKHRYISLLLPTTFVLAACSGEPSDTEGQVGTSTARSTASDPAKTASVDRGTSVLDSVPAEIRDQMLAQIPLKAAASQIRSAVATGSSGGFAGIELEDASVVLWWKGALPKSMEQAVNRARKSASVTVRAARYSLEELRSAASEVAAGMLANPKSTLHSVEIPVDGSGLILVSDVGASAPTLPRSVLGVSVTHEQRERTKPAGRLDDWAPFWGGARINNGETGYYCSTGFGVTNGSSEFILTAGHCGGSYTPFYNGNWANYLGSTAAERVDHDILLIATDAGGAIYWGGVGSGESGMTVAGWDWVYAGESLCGSPSVTGSVCGATASDAFTFAYCDTDMYGNYECYYDLVAAWNGTSPFQGGDSGGPIVSLTADGRAVAKGILSGVSDSGFFVFQDFGTAAVDFGITTL